MLPLTRMSPLISFLSLETAALMSPPITVEFFQVGFLSVVETTYFAMLLNLSENSSPLRLGQACAKPSYVTRPSNSASLAISSSYLNLSPSSPRLNLNAHPPRPPSAPPGSAATPSRVMNSETTNLLILLFSFSPISRVINTSPIFLQEFCERPRENIGYDAYRGQPLD